MFVLSLPVLACSDGPVDVTRDAIFPMRRGICFVGIQFYGDTRVNLFQSAIALNIFTHNSLKDYNPNNGRR